jgi:hypothetical protein
MGASTLRCLQHRVAHKIDISVCCSAMNSGSFVSKKEEDISVCCVSAGLCGVFQLQLLLSVWGILHYLQDIHNYGSNSKS